jgi:hypothetical protein
MDHRTASSCTVGIDQRVELAVVASTHYDAGRKSQLCERRGDELERTDVSANENDAAPFRHRCLKNPEGLGGDLDHTLDAYSRAAQKQAEPEVLASANEAAPHRVGANLAECGGERGTCAFARRTDQPIGEPAGSSQAARKPARGNAIRQPKGGAEQPAS